MKLTRHLLIVVILSVVGLSGCSKDSAIPTSPATQNSALRTDGAMTALTSAIKAPTPNDLNKPPRTIPAYYDSMLFNMIFKELPHQAEISTLAHNKSINTVYQSDPGLPGRLPFISVLDAIQGDGFNALWQEVQIAFNEGFTPRQLYSDTEILAAAAGPNPEITLMPTTEVYICAVVGKK
jgi:hypothetical protein